MVIHLNSRSSKQNRTPVEDNVSVTTVHLHSYLKYIRTSSLHDDVTVTFMSILNTGLLMIFRTSDNQQNSTFYFENFEIFATV